MGPIRPSLPLTAPDRSPERALRTPSSTVWLGHVCVATPRFEEALAFYVGTVGLAVRTIETHPLYPSQLRALLVDAEGRDVLELLEAEGAAEEAPAMNVSQLSFRLPRRVWFLLRVRLNVQEIDYTQHGDCLYVRDADGILLRIESMEAA